MRGKPRNGLWPLLNLLVSSFILNAIQVATAEEPPPRTSLTRPDLKYTVPESGYAVLKRGPVEAVIVDNRAVDDAILPKHRAGYHGVALLRHQKQPRNLFVPSYSGLNFEHIHDGTTQSRELLFEPRNVPMVLRQIDEFTAELYQPATPYWGLESCMRYELLESGAIELTFECIPRRDTFRNGYIGLFWASYLDTPESPDIHFWGRAADAAADAPPGLIRGATPKHGVLSTHLSVADQRRFPHASDFPLTLVFNESAARYVAPWYVGRSRGMALLQTFRPRDQVRFSQSPSGGGDRCPAWDFQLFIQDFKIDQRYQLVMRANYFPAPDESEAAFHERASFVGRAAELGLGNAITPLPNAGGGVRTAEKLKRGESARIFCLGDSVTGLYYHTGGIRAYTDLLGMALQRAVPDSQPTMFNVGISGNTTVDGLARLERDVLSHNPDLVTVMFGLNDVTRVPLEQYRANLVTIISRCWAVGAEVVLCTPNNVIDTQSRPISKLTQYCEVVHEVGRALNVPVADCYAGMEALRAKDPDKWRLLLSDEIHPNLDGHKRMAEIIAARITGQSVSLEEIAPPPLSFKRINEASAAGRSVKVLAMSPVDSTVNLILKKTWPQANFEIVPWTVANQTLPQLEEAARTKVRALAPDLVLIAVPRTATFSSREQFVRSYAWVMNWSLSFGNREWECAVIHPSVFDPDHPDPVYDDLIRLLVKAQDLQLIDRKPDDKRPAADILEAAFSLKR